MLEARHTYEVRPRKDHRGVDLISDVPPFGCPCYDGPNAVTNAAGYAMHDSRSHDGVIRVYDAAGNVIEAQAPGQGKMSVPLCCESPIPIRVGLAPAGRIAVGVKFPAPSPSMIKTPVTGIVTATSFFPSPLKSAITASKGRPTPSSNNRTCWKLPSAFPSSTLILFEWKFGTTRSAIPSPFRSPLARFVGLSAAR